MRTAFYSETHMGADRHASRPFSFLETILIESEAKEGKGHHPDCCVEPSSKQASREARLGHLAYKN